MKKIITFKVALFTLCFIGIIMIYSASSIWAGYKTGNEYFYLIRQLIFFGIALASYFFFSRFFSYHKFEKISKWLFLVSLVLLILVLIPGIGMTKNGSKSWIGINDFSFQPSEFVKFSFIIYTSHIASGEEGLFEQKKPFLFFILILLLVFGLIMLEPDFGTGLIILLTISLMLFKDLMKVKVAVICFILLMVGVVILVLSAPYRLTRILSYLDPWSDPLGSGFQAIQSLYALSPSGFFGYGLFNSRQKFFYLPEPQTDFIFAIIVEELGMVGGAIVIGLFLTLVIIGYIESIHCKNKFGMNLLFGFSTLLAIQVFINIGVVIGLLPVTGVTLPFISYGGSSLIVNMTMMGIMSNIMRENKIERE